MQRGDGTFKRTKKLNSATEIFALKKNALSEISEKLLKDVFSEFDESSQY